MLSKQIIELHADLRRAEKVQSSSILGSPQFLAYCPQNGAWALFLNFHLDPRGNTFF